MYVERKGGEVKQTHGGGMKRRQLSEEFEAKVGMHQGSVLSPFFAGVVDVVTEFARGCAKLIIVF